MSATSNSAEIKAAEQVMQNSGSLGYDYLMEQSDSGRAELLANRGALEYEEWKDLTDTVIEVREQQLNLVSDLRDAGLTNNATLAQLVTRWQTVDSISEEADIGMQYDRRGDEDDVTYGLDGAPLPIFQKPWRIDRRFLENSRQGPGGALDTTMVAQMTRAVSNTVENAFLNGWTRPVDGYEMYGFRNHPDRNMVSGSSWHDDTSDADDVRDDLLKMFTALENDEYDDGGYWLYLSRTEWQRLRKLLADFGGGFSGETNMRTRIQEEFDMELDRVRVTKNLPDGEAVMFVPSRDVVEVGLAEDIQPVQWESPSGGTVFMKLLGAMNLKLRSTAEGQMGVAHATGLNA